VSDSLDGIDLLRALFFDFADAELENMPDVALMADGEEKRRRMEDWVSNLDPHIGGMMEGDV
jgi:hypothetical protein